jgi:cytochrome c peroxidase
MKRFLECMLSNSREMFTWRAISFATVLIVCFGGLLFFSFAMRLVASPLTADHGVDRDVVAYPPASNTSSHLSVLAQLGRKMFFDPSLSHSGRLACASCHNPANAYAPANGLSVQLGGPELKNYGVRAVPSLTYLEHTPTFTIGPNSAIPDTDAPPAIVMPTADTKVASLAKADKTNAGAVAAESAVPQGGLNWDGRAETVQAQAFMPLLDPNEMDNHDRAEILDHLKKAAYADDIKKLFGANIFRNPGLALDESIYALVRFQFEDPSFHLYNSKYDAYLAGKATLTAAEERGRKLFEDPKKGNCSSCHIDKPSRDGLYRPAFTDYQFEALGAPRNLNIPATHDPHYYDLGLCGPYRKDYATAKPYCGLFKTPTLRNVATRRVFFHNGYFHSLRDVLHFYVERETDPGKWYPKRADGSVDRYDDLPAEYKKNVDVVDAPFDRKIGDKPALSDAEIDDIIAFLKTLTDGYGPAAHMNGGKQAKN